MHIFLNNFWIVSLIKKQNKKAASLHLESAIKIIAMYS